MLQKFQLRIYSIFYSLSCHFQKCLYICSRFWLSSGGQKKRKKYLKKYLAGKSGSVTFVTPRNWNKEVL